MKNPVADKSSLDNIHPGLLQKDVNIIIEKIIKFLFRRVSIESKSLETLQEYSSKGSIVYASFHSSGFSQVILSILLKASKIASPSYAYGYNPFLNQKVTYVLKRLFKQLLIIVLRRRFRNVIESGLIEKLIRKNKCILVSLLSEKLFLGRYMGIRHDSLIYLIDIQKKIEAPIYLVPQMIFWNMNPERTKKFFTSKSLGDRGYLSALFSSLKNVVPPFIKFLEPLNLKDEIAESESEDSFQIAIKIRNKLLESYHLERKVVLGPVIKSHQEMMEKILYHRDVLDQVKKISMEENKPEKKVKKKIYKYYKEIAADFSVVYVKFFKMSLDYVFRKLFDGIQYDPDFLEQVKEAMQKGPVVLTPSHKSHMDYLIISYILFSNQIMPPHIAAGVNLAFFPMGTIFRHSGAFFLRRSFKGLDLYSAVFKQYLKTLVSEGYPIEFFIEGGRTRTGKLVSPKMGFLNFLIEAIHEGYNKDLIFIPISISYDRILEEMSFQEELQGKAKEAESTSVLIESRKLLKRKHGKVYVTYNKPFNLSDVEKSIDDKSNVTSAVANIIVNKINEVTVVTSYALTTTAILLLSVKGFSRKYLETRLMDLYDFLVYTNVILSNTLKNRSNISKIVENVIDSYMKDRIIEETGILENNQEEKLEGLYVLNEENRTRISFYKNSIIHYFIPVAFYSLALMYLSKKNIDISQESIHSEFKFIKELFYDEFVYIDLIKDIAENEDNIVFEYMLSREVLIKRDDKIILNEDKVDLIKFYAKIVRDYIESYFVVYRTITEKKTRSLTRKDLIRDIRKGGIRMYHFGDIRFAESLSLPNYNNVLNKLIKDLYVKEDYIDKKNSRLEIVNPEAVNKLAEKTKEYIEIFG